MTTIHPWEIIISEGKARIIIPNPQYYKRPDGVFEPAWLPVFYNPLMKLNRDLTVLVVKKYYKKGFFIEPLGGTGIRGIRLALEAGLEGVINDIDPIAYYYIRRNIVLNNLEKTVKPFNMEANALLNNFTFTGVFVDYIDIDPYGSPIPFIDSAVKPLGKKALIGVTATDTGPLTCSHKHKALRRYGVRCIKVDFSKELGLRVLIYNIVFRAAGQDVALYPVLSYNDKYYYRVFFEADRSSNKAYKYIDECSGYIVYCRDTLLRRFVRELIEVKDLNCKKAEIIGPLWICGLGSIELTNELLKISGSDEAYASALSLLTMLKDEYSINTPYYRYDKLFGMYKVNMPPINTFIEKLRELGYRAYRTHFDPRGIKTDAPYDELVKVISSFSS